MNVWGWLAGALLIAASGGAWLYFGEKGKEDAALFIKPKVGAFEITVTSSGELKAKRSVDVMGPMGVRKASIWQLKIQNLVAEGMVVKKGDFVAELDKSEMSGKIKEVQNALQKAESQYTQAKLDCTLTLATARNELVNLKFALEENRLKKEQFRFEAPAVQRQADIDYEKAQRALEQARANYRTKTEQSTAKMAEVSSDLNTQRFLLEQYSDLLKDFIVKAPENGMFIYGREWGGKKRGVGSTINVWEPIVGTLPDLTEMESIT